MAAAEERGCAPTSCRMGERKFFMRVFYHNVVAVSVAHIVSLVWVCAWSVFHFFVACWFCARAANRVQWCSVRGNKTERGSLVILVPNAFFVVMFIVLAVMAVLMLRRGAVAEAVCATVAAVGCALPLVAIGLAPAAREGNVVAAAVVVAAYILTYVFTFGGAAGMFVFSRARVKVARVELEGEGK